MKVLVTGSEGLPGHAVVRMLEERGVPCLGVDLPAFDLTDAGGIYACVEKYAPDTIVHCAGYTNSDKAESLPERCAALNGLGTLTVARAAVRVGAKMLFLSSPHVFPCVGDQPYAPGDAYGPRYVFGMSKVQGEDAVRSLLTRYYIVRTDWIYGPGKQDFLRPLLKAAQESAHRILWTYTRSSMMNLIAPEDEAETAAPAAAVSDFIAWWQYAIMGLQGFFGLLTLIALLLYVKNAYFPKKKQA